MPMIFPGMDPYLEDPRIWPGVHHVLVVYLADRLQPQLPVRYVAAVAERVFAEWPKSDQPTRVEAGPLEIHEPYVEILDLHSGQKIVAVIEVVSPSNKAAGPGRESYLAKQREVLGSTAHLVEIDLLRTGQHVLAVPEPLARRRGFYDYLVCVNRAYDRREQYELYLRGLRERLPRVRIPLSGDDPDVPLDVQAVVAQLYDAGAYRRRFDYHVPCRPPLRPDDEAWVDQVIVKQAEGQAEPAPQA